MTWGSVARARPGAPVLLRARLRPVAAFCVLLLVALGAAAVVPSQRTAAIASPTMQAVPGPRPGASPVIVRQWGAIMESARRHNTLDVSNYQFAQLMEQMLMVEQGGDVCTGQVVCLSQVWYPMWSRIQASTNDERGTNASVGPGQIRPETAQQLSQGWIKHGGRIIRHGVVPAYPVTDPQGSIVSARLEAPDVSIEYLAANLAMGAAVARAFGYEPRLEDLARWHNTGVGWWTFQVERVPESTWLKGTDYVERVRAMGAALEAPAAPVR